MAIWILLALIVALLAFVRLAPSDAARWHQPVAGQEEKRFNGGVVRIVPGDAQAFARLAAIADSAPRTTRLAGSVEEGMLTYVTRTRWIGFPDYTTMQLVDGDIRIFARLRFGRSDLGVNGKRVEGWLSQM